MLCTRGIRMANNKMMPLHKLLGLTIFGLLIQRGWTINVPVGDESTRDQVALASNRQQQRSAEPTSNGNSNYQIYEIHNHYLSHATHGHANHLRSYARRSPFQQEIRIQHVNSPPPPPRTPPQQTAQHAPRHEDINVSFLSYAAAEGPNGQQITISEPVPRTRPQQLGANYLPPIRQSDVYVPDYRTQQHLTTHQQQQVAVSQQYFGNVAVQHAHKAAEYLPPLPAQGIQQVNYRPPLPNQVAVQTVVSAEQSGGQYDGYRGYNGCHANNCQTYPQPAVAAQVAPRDAGIVTQHYNSQQYQLIPVSASIQVAGSLPQHHAAVNRPAYYPAPDYVPSYNNAEVRATSFQNHQQPHYLQHYVPQQSPAQSQPQQQQQQQPILAPTIQTALPPGYEFEKPENAEQAIAELHSLQNEQKRQAALAQQRQQQQHQQLVNHVISYMQQLQQQQRLQQTKHAAQYVQPAPAPAFQAPVYLPPATAAVAAPQLSNYQQEPQMYSLNSFMTSVQPTQRYGYSSFSNVAAPQYATPVLQHSLPVASMYSEPATRPVVYAPAMSYQSNAVSQDYTTFTLGGGQQLQQPQTQLPLSINEQTRQSLQSLMPKDIQVQQQLAVGGTGKVRTVQIVNSHLIKTLKVLETHDGAGVKTIKILGATNEHPMGTHQTVRVVSPSKTHAHQENVQTVKIFNDHKDVQLAATLPNNAYLPAAPEKKRTVRDSHEAHALPQALERSR